MTYDNEYLIHLLSCAIRSVKPKNPDKSVDWKTLHDIAEKQKVSPLVYESICRLDLDFLPPKNLMEIWEKESITVTYFFALQSEQIRLVLNEADKRGIKMVVLKGTVLRELYPIPELRTMNDCDVIIKRDQIENVKELFSDLGYNIKQENDRTIEFTREGNLKFELFYSVFSRLKPDKEFDGDLWKDAETFIGEHIFKPSPEKFFVHSIAHLAKHFITRGAGIRNLADIVLLAERTDIDWQDVIIRIKHLNLEKFFYGIMASAKKYFDLNLDIDCPKFDDNMLETFVEFMISNGVYGITDNVFVTDAKNAGGNRLVRFKNYLKSIFPTKSGLADRYEYAKKFPVLLPIAWVHRFYIVLVKDRRSVTLLTSASGKAKTHLEVLDYFDLWYEA